MTKLPSYECPFKVGDTVIPIQPPVDEEDRPPYWVWELEEFVGQEATVMYIDTLADELDEDEYQEDGYSLQLDISGDYNWRDTWLKLIHTDYTLF